MAVSFGELLGGAGRISRRGEQAGQELRDFERDRAALDEMRRMQALNAEISRRGLATRLAGQAPDTPGPGAGVQFGTPPVAAPTPPAGAMPIPVSAAGGGRGDIIPPLAGQPQPTYPPEGVPLFRPYQDPAGFTPPAGMTGPQNLAALQQERLRRFANPQQTAQEDAAVRQYLGATQPPPTDMRPPAPAPAPSGLTDKERKLLQGYDNKRTPYDALMTEAAQQYGIDPVAFKRLIGTESSFNPKAVSPRGKNFGLGIAQIASVHNLSDADRLNPEVAIPFAAQLFAQYLSQAGGNYEEALMRYKGASSERGRAAMASPARIITSGLQIPGAAPAAAPEGQAPAPITEKTKPAEAADAVVKAATYGTMYGPGSIDASPNNPQMRQLMQERDTIVEKIQLMEQYGFGRQAMELVPIVRGIDLGIQKAQADQSIYEGETTGNFSRAMAIMSNFRQQAHQTLDRGDGTFDLYVGGKLARTAVSSNEIADMLRTSIDEEYRAQKAMLAGKQAEHQMKLQEILTTELMKAQGNMQVALINAQAELLKQKVISSKDDLKFDTATQMWAVRQNGRWMFIDPTETTEVRGQKVATPTARPIGGLR